MPKIIHYRERCIGCNSCVEHAPSHWTISKTDGKSDLIGAEKKKGCFVQTISQVELDANWRAARDCPVHIIQIIED